jgi:MFS family permease
MAVTDNKNAAKGSVDAFTPPLPYTLFTKGERRTIVVLIALAGWFSTLSSFIYYPAISMMATDLQTSTTLINLTVTSYMVVSGIAPSLAGDASDTFGRRPLYVFTLTLYVVANVGIALQHSFVALLLLRMLQSAGISGELLFIRRCRREES